MIRLSTNIYDLKMRWGQSVVFLQYDDDSGSINYSTGAVDKRYTPYYIRKAVVLPREMTRDFVYGGIRNPYRVGGYFDEDTRTFLIDGKDLGIIPTLNDYIRYSGLYYKIDKIIHPEPDIGHILICKRSEPGEIIPMDMPASQSLTFSQSVIVVKEGGA